MSRELCNCGYYEVSHPAEHLSTCPAQPQPKLDAGDVETVHDVSGECLRDFHKLAYDDAIMLTAQRAYSKGYARAKAEALSQPVPSQSDEEAAEKYARGRDNKDPGAGDIEVSEREVHEWIRDAVLFGCQHKEHSLRGAFTSNEKDKLVKDIQGMKACIAEYEKDYAEWVQERHALGKEITEMKHWQKEKNERAESYRLLWVEVQKERDEALARMEKVAKCFDLLRGFTSKEYSRDYVLSQAALLEKGKP